MWCHCGWRKDNNFDWQLKSSAWTSKKGSRHKAIARNENCHRTIITELPPLACHLNGYGARIAAFQKGKQCYEIIWYHGWKSCYLTLQTRPINPKNNTNWRRSAKIEIHPGFISAVPEPNSRPTMMLCVIRRASAPDNVWKKFVDCIERPVRGSDPISRTSLPGPGS